MRHARILRSLFVSILLGVVLITGASAEFGAIFLRKAITPGQMFDFAQFERLDPELKVLAFSVLFEEGRAAREARIRAELLARGETEVLKLLGSVDPAVDLDRFELQGGWQFVGLDVAYTPLPPLDWVVRPVLSRPSVNIFFGPPKSLKSLILSDLAICTAIGGRWLATSKGTGGFETVASPVAWLDLENGPRRMAERFSAFGRARSAPATAPVKYLSMPNPWPDFSQPGSAGLLISQLEAMGARLVVLDHLSQVLGQTEENSAQMAPIMAQLRGIAEYCNAAVVIIHHQVKSAGRFGISASDSIRGHGSILASCDFAAVVERAPGSKDAVTVRPVAVRGAPVEAFGAQFSWEHKQDGSKELATARFYGMEVESMDGLIEAAILEALEGGSMNQTELRAIAAEESGAGDQVIRKVIARMESGGRVKVKGGKQNSKIYSLPGGEDG